MGRTPRAPGRPVADRGRGAPKPGAQKGAPGGEAMSRRLVVDAAQRRTEDSTP